MIFPKRFEIGYVFTKSEIIYNIFKPFIFKIPMKQAQQVEEYVKFQKLQIPKVFPEQIIYNWLKSNDDQNQQDILSNLGVLCINDKQELQSICQKSLDLLYKDVTNKDYKIFEFIYDFNFHTQKRYDIFIHEFSLNLFLKLQEFFNDNDQLELKVVLGKVLEYKYEPLFFKDCLKGILKLIQIKKNFVLQDIDLKEEKYQKICEELDQQKNIFESLNFLKENLDNKNKEFIHDLLLEFTYLIENECQSKEHKGLQGLELVDIYLEIINVLNGTSTIIKNEYYKIFQKYNCYMIFKNFNIQSLNQNDFKFRDFHDHFILRFYTYTNQRSHFPLLIVSENPQYYTKDIHMDMRLNQHDIAIFDFTHMYRSLQMKMLDQLEDDIFKKNRINMLQRFSGQNPNTLNFLMKLIADNCATANNLEQLIKNNCSDIKDEFQQKIQQILSQEIVQEEYDENQYFVIFKLFKFLDQINHYKNKGIIYIEHIQYETLLEDPVLKALIDLDILYFEKLSSVLLYKNPLYIVFCEDWVKQQKKKLPLQRYIQYYFWFKIESNFTLQRSKNFYYLTKQQMEHYKEQIPYEYQPMQHMHMYYKDVINGHIDAQHMAYNRKLSEMNEKVINQI